MRALSIFWRREYSSLLRMNLYRMAVCLIPVVFVGIDGAGPGLAGLVKAVADRVAYTVSETARARKLSLLLPRVVCIDSTLAEIW